MKENTINNDINSELSNNNLIEEEKIINDVINDIKPYLNNDGGDIEFIKYEDDYVFVKLFGACSHCGYQDFTLNDNILEIIKEKIPTVKGVINVEI